MLQSEKSLPDEEVSVAGPVPVNLGEEEIDIVLKFLAEREQVGQRVGKLHE